ncbi:MAG: efflux RND transporter permease subunit [Gammaproteobacteria bacterium]
MKLTDIFVRRPVLAAVLSLVILMVGAKSYFNLPVRLFPKISSSVVNVSVRYAGADAELMEGFISSPIENALSGIDGIDTIVSQSKMGESDITIRFNLGYDINAAVSDVNSKVSSIRSQLPEGIDNPVVEKIDPDARPTIFISFSNDSLLPEQITDYLLHAVQPQIQTLPGVAQVAIWGPKYAMRVWLNPQLMAARNVTLNDLHDALYTGNVQAPGGTLETVAQKIRVKPETELATSKEFNDIIIRESKGDLVRLQDVGHAELSADTLDIKAYLNSKPTVILAVTPGPIANPLDVSQEITKILPQITMALPPGTTYSVPWDTSRFIKSSINEVKSTIIEATICVIAIVFLLLFSWRILLIPIVAIPISLIGVCGVMLWMGYSLNSITFLAMVLAIGMVVDDAIVVLENIHRHLTAGNTPRKAAILGAREIQFAVISMTLTLAAVYAPIGFLSGLLGTLFKEFAFTLASAVIISGFVALTLSPMMCSKIMTPNVLHNRGALYVHNLFAKFTLFYGKLLRIILKHRLIIVIGLPLLLITTFFIFKSIPSEIAPREDIGAVEMLIGVPSSSNIAYTEQYAKEIEKIIAGLPEVESYLNVNRADGGFAALVLKDWGKRKRGVEQIVAEISPKLWSIPGVMVNPVFSSMLPGSDDAQPIKLAVQTQGDYNELNAVMQKLKAAAYANPGFAYIDVTPKFDQFQFNMRINRDKAGDLGVPIKDIGAAINIALGEPKVTKFALAGHGYDVIPQLAPEFRNKPDALNMLYLRSNKNELIPLANLLTFKEVVEPQSVMHFQQMRSAFLVATLKPGYTIGQAIDYLQELTKTVVPKTMQLDYSGESRRFLQNAGAMGATFGFALLFIFLILAAQFESFRDPFIVLFSVPLSIFGALLAMLLTGCTMNIYSEIGLVTLVGLISKHGILIVEFANKLQMEGKTIHEAIIEAASIRLRPILMTTAAMVLGSLPLAMASGAGAVSRREIGIVLIAGMLIGTLFTLFVVPTIYTYLATKKHKALFWDAEI